MKKQNRQKNVVVSPIKALRIRRPDDAILKYSSSLEDITEDAGDKVCRLRAKGMTKKEIAKKIHKSDRYVAAVLDNYIGAIGLPKVMNKSARKHLQTIINDANNVAERVSNRK